MVVCDKESCMSWTHHECAGLTEEAARTSSYWCKNCVDEFVDNQNSDDKIENDLTPLNHSSTPNKTKNIDIISLSSKTDISSILNNSSFSDLLQPKNSFLTAEPNSQDLSNKENSLKFCTSINNHYDKQNLKSNENDEVINLSASSEITKLITELRNKISDELDNPKSNENSNTDETQTKFTSRESEKINESLHSNKENPTESSAGELANLAEIQNLKALIAQKNMDIDTYVNKILHLEDLLNLKGSPQQTKHRLEHRNVQSIVKEYAILEERLKVTQSQLNQEQNLKLSYKQKLFNISKENEILQLELNQLKNQRPDDSTEALKEKDTVIVNLTERVNELQKESNDWIKSKQNSIDLENIIKNLEDQLALDDEIKRNLNDCLEEAYSEIKDLYEVTKNSQRQVKNKSTSTTEITNQQEINSNTQQVVIDLSLPTRSRAKEYGESKTTNHQPYKRDNQLVGLSLDNSQLEHQQIYRRTFQNFKTVPNYLQRLEKRPINPTPPNDADISHNSIKIIQDLHNYQPANDRNPLSLHSRFTMQNRIPSPTLDAYDFAAKDNNNERTRNRPVCKWWLRNQCNSEVCIYRHSESDEISGTNTYSAKTSNRQICRYAQQNRCWFGEWHCRNLHPGQY